MSGFNLVSWKKRSKAAMSAAKSAVIRGMAEGESSGKAKLLSPGTSLEEPLSRPKNSERTPGTGLSGKVTGSLGPLVGSAGLVETLAASIGLAWPAEGLPGPAAGSGETSGETRPAVSRNECHNCSTGNCHANCPMRSRSGSRSRPKEGMKWKRSGATEQTPDGKKGQARDKIPGKL